jgi:hypothetical protein
MWLHQASYRSNPTTGIEGMLNESIRNSNYITFRRNLNFLPKVTAKQYKYYEMVRRWRRTCPRQTQLEKNASYWDTS